MNPGAVTDCTLLLVDDEEANLDLLEGFLRSEGYRSLIRTPDARHAVALFRSCAPDLVLLDLHMPHRSGLEVLQEIRENTPVDDYLPVLVLTADVTPEAKERALSGGARDFLTKPLDVIEVLLRVRNLLETRLLHRSQREARQVAEAAEQRAALLAEASKALGASLDMATSMSQLVQLLVPRVADACVLRLNDRDGQVPFNAMHVDPARRAALGDAISAAEIDTLLESVPCGDQDAPASTAAAENSAPRERAVIVPLRIRDQAIGGLLLVRCPERPQFDAETRALAEELANRAALAVENARLFADAQWATRARERMLSVVAHDLRNPLAVVTMYAEMLLSMLPPGGDSYQQEALASIFQSAERMQHLIEDLLDAARVQQGTFALDPFEQPLKPLLQEAERMLRPIAEANGIRIEFEGTGEAAGRTAFVDGARFLQVLSNLVGNAVKFTPEGGSVTVSWAPADEHLRISVADTGPGISAEQLPHIFGAFWQAREADRHGVGLGLWISRAIVEAHRGQIWVDSREGSGAVFHFTVPSVIRSSAEGPEAEPVTAGLDAAWVG